MSLPTVSRGGRLLRVCDPSWPDPLDTTFSTIRGGRWNEPGSVAVLYLNADARTARANVARRFRDLPYGLEDLAAHAAPELVAVDVATGDYADCESDYGLVASGLPASYPFDSDGREVGWDPCQPVGRAAFEQRLAGVACRSAAGQASADLREVARFAQASSSRPELVSRTPFALWFRAAPA